MKNHINFLIVCFVLISTQFASAVQLPIGAAQVLRYEQKYVNRNLDTKKIIALKNYQAKEFSPEGGLIFDVESYWIDANQLYVFESQQADIPKDLILKRNHNGKAQVLFLIHPESMDFYTEFIKNTERGPLFKATATASSRTLMMWPEKNPQLIFFGKLSLNKEVAGVVRTIPKGEVARSVGMTQILDSAKSELPNNFKFLPEFFGAMPKGMDRGGMLLRSLPEEYKSGDRHLMPLFALYTKPQDLETSPLQDMISKSNLSAEEFVIRKILQPFGKQWAQLTVKNGLAIEAHAQNVLVEIDKSGMISDTYVYRDFGGFNVDLEMRKSKNLAMPAKLPVIDSIQNDYHQEFHNKAIVQSLYTYYEGGFLFGLSADLKRMGYDDLSYLKLTNLLHEVIKNEFSFFSVKVDLKSFYPDLIKSVDKARKTVPLRLQCQSLFR